MDSMTLKIIGLVVGFLIVLISSILLINNNKKKKLKTYIDQLEYDKNQIDCSPISPELSKIESFLKNEKLEIMYNDWTSRLDKLKKEEIPKLTDMIIEAEYSVQRVDHKSSIHKLAKLEIEVYKARTYSDNLLSEILEITTSEEKNRAIITKLKEKYRNLFRKYDNEKSEYGSISPYVKLQFENISSRFEQFEQLMEQNEYTEVTQVIKSINEMLTHMEVVVEEIPLIVMTATNLLDKKIASVQKTYEELVASGYPLDYLNVEYNIKEASKKVDDIMDRLKVLNLEDSLFELNVLMEYFDSLFNDFEKEKKNRASYEETKNQFEGSLKKLNGLVKDIFSQINELKNVYDLSTSDIDVLNGVKKELDKLNDDFKTLLDHTKNNTFAYSKLITEISGLTKKLKELENKIDNTLKSIGNMKEDEVRARQQLDEVRAILKDSRLKIRDYNLPLIPKSYFVELNEATDAIKEVVKELGKVPITISVLNTRVDTARDLVLKFYNTNKEMIKIAMFAEMAIVYGNRYRSSDKDTEKNLSYSEVLFYRGEYEKSLELTINSLNKMEAGIYEKLLQFYEERVNTKA